MTAILTSFEAGFGPFERELDQLSQEIRDLVSLLSKQAEKQERDLQSNEREDARAHRKLLVKFSDTAQREYRDRQNLQLQMAHRRAEKQRQRVLSAFSAYNHQKAYNQLRKECMPRTSTWILTEAGIKQLIEGTIKSLCLTGKCM